MRTQVAIVGGGPAGLLLSQLLAQSGIDSVVLESRPKEYAEGRVRASVLEPATVRSLRDAGVGGRLGQEGIVLDSLQLRFDGEDHRIPIKELTGGGNITIYDQQEVVKDLIRARQAAGGRIEFGSEAVGILNITSERPMVRYRRAGEVRELECDVVAGCDGYWGISRSVIPSDACKIYRRDYPFRWLGILSARADRDVLTYASDERGFLLWGLRDAKLTRAYLQWPPNESAEAWSDERLWNEIGMRLGRPDIGDSPQAGPIVERATTTLHSFVIEPMQHGRLFLVGDSAHTMPPTAAKGMNLAVADARLLAEALEVWLRLGRTELVEAYSSTCLRRAWLAEHISWWMTWLLHRSGDEFDHQLQRAQLRQITESGVAARHFAEWYLGPDCSS